MTAPDKYGVVGNPIAHSRSPEIHQRFARQTRERISYERIEVPLDAFEERALALRDAGFRGLNVTVPFKIDAAKLADDLMPRARLAGAVNTLRSPIARTSALRSWPRSSGSRRFSSTKFPRSISI